VDQEKKLIMLEIKGKMEREELDSFDKEINDVLNQFPPKSMALISLLERMDPLSQENARLMKNITRECVLKTERIAVVHKRTVTQMQLKRLEKEVQNDGYHGVPIMRFTTRNDALVYIRKREINISI
jgi:hypothetical protein